MQRKRNCNKWGVFLLIVTAILGIVALRQKSQQEVRENEES